MRTYTLIGLLAFLCLLFLVLGLLHSVPQTPGSQIDLSPVARPGDVFPVPGNEEMSFSTTGPQASPVQQTPSPQANPINEPGSAPTTPVINLDSYPSCNDDPWFKGTKEVRSANGAIVEIREGPLYRVESGDGCVAHADSLTYTTSAGEEHILYSTDTHGFGFILLNRDWLQLSPDGRYVLAYAANWRGGNNDIYDTNAPEKRDDVGNVIPVLKAWMNKVVWGRNDSWFATITSNQPYDVITPGTQDVYVYDGSSMMLTEIARLAYRGEGGESVDVYNNDAKALSTAAIVPVSDEATESPYWFENLRTSKDGGAVEFDGTLTVSDQNGDATTTIVSHYLYDVATGQMQQTTP